MSPANDNLTPDVDWSHVEISAGTVSEAYIEGAGDRRPLFSEFGPFRFFIDVIDVQGGRFGLDTCADYETAIRLAEEARVDFEIELPVKDNVAGVH